jgi:hypothetical protein
MLLRGAGALDGIVRPVYWLEMLGFVPHPNLWPYDMRLTALLGINLRD